MIVQPLGFPTTLDAPSDYRRAARPHDVHETMHRRTIRRLRLRSD